MTMKSHRKLNRLETRKPEYKTKPEKCKNHKDHDIYTIHQFTVSNTNILLILFVSLTFFSTVEGIFEEIFVECSVQSA